MSTPLKDTPGVTFNPQDEDLQSYGQEDDPLPDFLWCSHCLRAYRRGLFILRGDLRMCPYKCGGDAVMDAWPWPEVQEHSEEYPTEPEEFVIYR